MTVKVNSYFSVKTTIKSITIRALKMYCATNCIRCAYSRTPVVKVKAEISLEHLFFRVLTVFNYLGKFDPFFFLFFLFLF